MQRDKPFRVLVTGGPTRAYLDRVRFLSNVSTGALAFELCRRLKAAGIAVSAVIGQSSYDFESLKLDELHRVETTDEMHQTVLRRCRAFRPAAAVFSAAVLDFAPVKQAAGKISSSRSEWTLKLRPTPKIIDDVGARFPKIRRVGFKLEWKKRTGPALEKFAQGYLRKKKLAGLCVNFLPEVSPKQHLAYLFSGNPGYAQARDKAAIAEWILRLITK